jgi:hypothetical protein
MLLFAMMSKTIKGKKRLFMDKKLVLFAAVLLFSSLSCLSDALAVYGDYSAYSSQNKYTLTGVIQLTYDREWGTVTSQPITRFNQNYYFVFDGFVVDRRIMAFQINGLFNQDIYSPGGTVTGYGFGASATFLSERVKRGPLQYIPQPINIRYSFFHSQDTDWTNYGISLTYKLPERSPAVYQQKQQERRQPVKKGADDDEESNETPEKPLSDNLKPNENLSLPPKTGPKFGIALPTFYLDYDRYIVSSFGSKGTTDFLSLRAETVGTYSTYLLEYDYSRSHAGSDTSTMQRLWGVIDVNYVSGTTRFFSNNQLFLTDSKSADENLRTLFVSNRELWSRSFGPDLRDNVTAQGGGFYRSSNDGSHNYGLDLAGSFNKLLFMSDRFSNAIGAGAGIARNDQNTSHSETVTNDLSYHLSRIFLFSNNITAGNTNDGRSFSTALMLTTKTRIVATADYIYTMYSVPDGRTTNQSADLTVSGPLYENFSFSTQAHYRIVDTNTLVQSKEKSWELRADLYWYLYGYSINLGASYLDINSTSTSFLDDNLTLLSTSGNIRSRTETLYGGISKSISRRLFASLISSYQRNKFSGSGSTSALQVHPMLGFYWRQLVVTAEYIYTRQKDDVSEIGTDTKTDHRLIFRLTRTFQARFGR